MTRRLPAACALLAAGLVAAACGPKPSRFELPPLESTIPSTAAASITVNRLPSAGTTDSTLDTTGTTAVSTSAWEPATLNLTGLDSSCGNLAMVTTRPDRDEVLVSVFKQGMFSMKPGETSYRKLGQGKGSAVMDNGTTAILFDPTNPDTFWESGAYSATAVFKTTDGGETFKPLGAIEHSDPMSVDFSDPQRLTMLSGQHEQNRLRRSVNGGATWTDVAGLPASAGYLAYPHVIDANTYLVGTYSGAKPGIFRSTDAGATWTQLFTGNINSAPLVASDAIYYVLDTGAVVKSTDRGATWAVIRAPGALSTVSKTMMMQLPDGRLAAMGRSLVVSEDKGKTWKTLGPPLPYQANGFAFNRFQSTFYIWRYDCDSGKPSNPVGDNNIMKLVLKG